MPHQIKREVGLQGDGRQPVDLSLLVQVAQLQLADSRQPGVKMCVVMLVGAVREAGCTWFAPGP